jgi:hypothetical protein
LQREGIILDNFMSATVFFFTLQDALRLLECYAWLRSIPFDTFNLAA